MQSTIETIRPFHPHHNMSSPSTVDPVDRDYMFISRYLVIDHDTGDGIVIDGDGFFFIFVCSELMVLALMKFQ